MKNSTGSVVTMRSNPGDVPPSVDFPESLEPHEILGVEVGAPEGKIEAAYRRLVKRVHPDTGEEPDGEKFKRVNEAREELLNEVTA